jgi:hypothetical protein
VIHTLLFGELTIGNGKYILCCLYAGKTIVVKFCIFFLYSLYKFKSEYLLHFFSYNDYFQHVWDRKLIWHSLRLYNIFLLVIRVESVQVSAIFIAPLAKHVFYSI